MIIKMKFIGICEGFMITGEITEIILQSVKPRFSIIKFMYDKLIQDIKENYPRCYEESVFSDHVFVSMGDDFSDLNEKKVSLTNMLEEGGGFILHNVDHFIFIYNRLKEENND